MFHSCLSYDCFTMNEMIFYLISCFVKYFSKESILYVQEPGGPGHRRRNTANRAGTPVNRSPTAQDTAHTWGGQGTGKNQYPMDRTHWGDPADPPGQWQEWYSKATGPSPARLHRGPWQTSPGAMEATGDRRAGTQSRRGSPAKQSGPATQATRVRRWYRRQAGAIPLVVRDTPHGWAAP